MHEALMRSREGFAQQPFMTHLGASLTHVGTGEVTIELPSRESLTQQHGFIHAGAISSVMDTACGFAALTTLPADQSVLTAEFKINLLRPARGAKAVVRGSVLKAGRTLVVCKATAHMVDERSVEDVAPCAYMVCTIAAVAWTPDLDAASTTSGDGSCTA